ncbi:MAG: T9SS type A sorting domain-containing protein [Chitinophagaceae bacterium]|nr:T9SS type A sorting domain-containing protein [Chitinophagaceae bacterium]
MKLVFLLLFIGVNTICNSLHSQEYKRNYNWVVGFVPGLKFNFSSNLSIDTFTYLTGLRTGSCISDTNGNLLFFSNGYGIGDYEGNLMQNGDTVNSPDGSMLYSYYGGGGIFDQTSIILPKKDNTYYVFSTGMTDSVANNYLNHIYTEFDVLNYSIVDMDSNAGKGKVVEKNKILLEDQHYVNCALTAVKHANGKDWWLVKADCANHRYQEFIVREDTILGPYYQTIVDTGGFCAWLSQIYFSNDGNIFASSMYGQYDANGYNFNRVDIYNFDRCTGNIIFKNYYIAPYDTLTYPNDDMKVGICFSPDGKLIYMSNLYTIYQIDVEDSNKYNALLITGPDTTIAQFPWYSTMASGPNGKLYIGNSNGTRKFMSYVDSPNVKGLGCNFVPQGVWQPYTNLKSPPNMPNYGLGKDTTVNCDPIGLEESEKKNERVTIFPNPSALGMFNVECSMFNERDVELEVYTLLGQKVLSQVVKRGTLRAEVDVRGLGAGVYFLKAGLCSPQAGETWVRKVVVE